MSECIHCGYSITKLPSKEREYADQFYKLPLKARQKGYYPHETDVLGCPKCAKVFIDIGKSFKPNEQRTSTTE